MSNFSQQYVIIYDYFKTQAEECQKPSSKLDLARLLGVSQGQMQNWEKGQRPNAVSCLAIHKKLGFEFEWLITGEGPSRRDEVGDAQTPPTPYIDVDLLQKAIEPIEAFLRTKKQVLSPADKAKLFAQSYALLLEQKGHDNVMQRIQQIMDALIKDPV